MKFYVITDGQIEALVEKIKHLILKEAKPLNLPQLDDQESMTKAGPRVIRRRAGKPRLADLILETVKEDIFDANQAFDEIKDKYPFKGGRGIDAVRTALKSNPLHFHRLEDGRYEKIKKDATK